LSSRSHNSARSDLANVTSDHRTGTGWAPLHGRWRQGQCSRRALRGATIASTSRKRDDQGKRCWNNGRVTDPAPAVAGSMLDPEVAALLKRDPAGLVTAVIQEDRTGEVLMVGWMDDVALHKTLTTGRSTFFSRSRGEYWVKGETSGHRQWVREVRLDCDGDTVLVKVHQEGGACHTGDRTCFDRRRLAAVVVDPGQDPAQ
jgi:phosphoribosyl-AMP cyclohydrolase